MMTKTSRISAALSLLLCFGCHNPFARRPHDSMTPCKANLENLATVLEMYASDSGGFYPTSWAKLASGNYLVSAAPPIQSWTPRRSVQVCFGRPEHRLMRADVFTAAYAFLVGD